MKIILRQSDFATFMQCRRKFYLQTQLLETVEKKITSANLGTAIHTALRAHYLKQDIPYACSVEVQELSQSGYGIDEIEAVYTQAQEIVEAYIAWADDRFFTPVLVEERIDRQVGVFGDIDLWMSGQIDLVVADRMSEKFKLIDHKSVTNLAQNRASLQINFQGLSYAWLLQEKEIFVSGLIHNQLRRVNVKSSRSKPPFFSREEVIWTDQQQANHVKHLEGLGRDISVFLERTQFNPDQPQDLPYPHLEVYPTPGQHCSWSCRFKDICPMFDDGSDVKGAIELGFKIGGRNGL